MKSYIINETKQNYDDNIRLEINILFALSPSTFFNSTSECTSCNHRPRF